MKDFYASIDAAACSEDCVLLLGESGSGKSYAAELIHKKSLRATFKLLHINVSEINDNFIESYLFGTVRGAFTGAGDSAGIFEIADKGTLFLDEIGEMPLFLQSKLLNVVENKVFKRLGSQKELHCNPRLIFATNVDIRQRVKERLFRSDLFYRINAITIDVPSLRDHKEDIPSLATSFAKERNKKLSCNAIEKLCDYYWPGNIRQLKNSIMRASVFCKTQEIKAEDVVFD